jgi:NAD(P)-dependent dehydrogenase (short-subunit alcohol dehydrogenase family)
VTVTPALNKIPGSQQIIANAMGRNPLGRLTLPEDVARALVLLASDHAGWLNGTVVRLDGGEDAVELDWSEKEA